jgi:hypothetical protein
MIAADENADNFLVRSQKRRHKAILFDIFAQAQLPRTGDAERIDPTSDQSQRIAAATCGLKDPRTHQLHHLPRQHIIVDRPIS